MTDEEIANHRLKIDHAIMWLKSDRKIFPAMASRDALSDEIVRLRDENAALRRQIAEPKVDSYSTCDGEMDIGSVRARVVGNAVYLEHVGGSGDIAAWGMPSRHSAEFVAGAINLVLNAMRAALADAQTAAGRYAHETNERISALEAENAEIREQVEGHCERIAKQSDQLSRRAEKPADDTPRLREALAWAVGYMRCNLGLPSLEGYPDWHNAVSLAHGASIYGPFWTWVARAELAENVRDELARRLAEMSAEGGAG